MNLPEDRVIRERMILSCEQLNRKYGGGFFGYLREREYSQGENCYCGKERKRGAILEFARDVSGSAVGKRVLGDSLDGGNLRYLVTLDGDTSIGFRQIYSLIGAMLHPLNRPLVVTKGGQAVVQKGHAILQPGVGVGLNSAGKSALSILLCGAGGRDPYHGGGFDFFQDGYGVGMFCGKGIIDLPTYVSVCGGAFPDDLVLSHDILEGARLRCGYVRDEVFTDGVPFDSNSVRSRKHRWIRGDIQALCFAGKRVKNAKGIRGENPIEKVYRFALWDNAIGDLLPFAIFLSLLMGLITNGAMAWQISVFALLPLLLPTILTLLGALATREWRKISGRYFSRVLNGFWLGVTGFLYECVSLVSNGISSVDACFRSLWRMKVSHRNLLEWTTFSGLKSQRGFLTHLKKNLWSLIIGALVFVIGADRPIRIFGFFWLLYPLISFFVSRPFKGKKEISEQSKEILRKYIRDGFSYFEANVNQKGNFLPPDNISLSPCESVAYRTSPTNVGLYLLCLLAARDEEWITTAQMKTKILQTVSTVEQLEKYKGNLYNWYDISTCEVLGNPYVSTVDSGNLCVCLVTLAQGLREYCYEDHSLKDLIRRVEALVNQMRFDFLYDSKRHLFFIGYDCKNEKADENHYDLYMSEARMTSFYCVAKGLVPSLHWQCLQRSLVEDRGYVGAASWTGTCFEYFMPSLLLPVFPNSFESESLRFACRQQKNFLWGDKKVFGVSESGFFAFDAEMNYQYRAFGVPNLRLKREQDNTMVISPYSSFLMLRADASSMLSNLERLKKCGMYGKYGFYEALDCDLSRTGGSAIVKSYMAHHLGMSILAASNALHSDCFVKRFCRESSVCAALVLLEERIPVDAVVLKTEKAKTAFEKKEKKTPRQSGCRVMKRNEHFLYPGKESALTISTEGENGYSFHSGGRRLLMNRPLKVGEHGGFLVRVALGDRVFSNCRRENPDGSIFSVYSQADGLDYCIRNRGVLVRIRFSLLPSERSPLEIAVRVRGYCGMAKASVECHPILCEKERFNAHPAFANLFLEVSPQKEDNALMLVRRARGEEEEVCSFLGFKNDGDSENSYSFGEPEQFAKDRLFSKEKEEMAMLYSHLMITQRKMLYPTSSSSDFVFVACCGKERSAVRESFLAAREAKGNHLGERAFHGLYDPCSCGDVRCLENTLLQKCSYENLAKLVTRGGSYPVDKLWSYGISGDVPVLCADFSRVNKKTLSEILYRKRIHYLCGIMYDLVVIVRSGGYRREEFDAFAKMVFDSKTGFLLGKKGGIHPVNDDSDTKIFFADVSDLLWEEEVPRIDRLPFFKIEPVECENKQAEGSFCSDGFLIQKKSFQFPPWSHILASKSGGTLITDRDLGYTWWKNCALKRITRWNNDAFSMGRNSETVIATFSDKKSFDLIRQSQSVGYFGGEAVYRGEIRGVSYVVRVMFHPRFSYKSIRVELFSSQSLELKIGYRFVPVMGSNAGYPSSIKVEPICCGVRFQRVLCENDFFASGFILAKGDGKLCEPIRYLDSSLCLFQELYLPSEQRKFMEFRLGAFHSARQLERINEDELKEQYAKDFVVQLLTLRNCCKRSTSFYPFWLSYQTVFGRSLAKTGFYQSGGAFGFRDQLQDSLIYLSFAPQITKEMLIRCAAHQFEEGDVLHWWHNIGPAPHRGVRTQCSDDYLWLIWVLCEYLKHTGDDAILEVKIPFLQGAPLKQEAERYAAFEFSKEKHSMREHVRRMVSLFFSRGFGGHGLAYMGSGDWNDGMNLVGKDGGESVWLTMFAVIVFSNLARLGVLEEVENTKLQEKCKEMLEALDRVYNGDWYPRAYFGNGMALGNDLSLQSECSIDLLPQAFSVFVYELVPESRNEQRRARMIRACENAMRILFSEKEGVLRLFSSSFRFCEPNPGYIRSYSAGVRENGGQYTHAAVWFCWALYYLSKHSPDKKEEMKLRLKRILDRICPDRMVENEKEKMRYKNEPYVLSGDVYWASDAKGRGGWSWYTGASGWLYRLLEKLEEEQIL